MHCHSLRILYSAGRPLRTTPSHDRAPLFAENTVCLLHIQRHVLLNVQTNTVRHFRQVGASGREPSRSPPSALATCACAHSHFAQRTVMALSAHETHPSPELVEQWISLLACWADSFFARQHKIALLIVTSSSSCELAFTRAPCILPAC